MAEEIRFPSKMEVVSPKTDALINAQIAAFAALSTNLETGFSQLLGGMQTLEKMPEIVAQFRRQVETQLSAIFTHQLEGSIVARHATLLSLRRTAVALERLLNEKTKQLAPDRERIMGRYRELLGKVALQCEEKIRELDSHALELVENVYPSQVQRYFSAVSTPTVALLAEHHEEAARKRREALRHELERVRSALHDVQQLARSLDMTLGDMEVREIVEPGWYVCQGIEATVAGVPVGRQPASLVITSGSSEASDELQLMLRTPDNGTFVEMRLSDGDLELVREILTRRGRSDIAARLA